MRFPLIAGLTYLWSAGNSITFAFAFQPHIHANANANVNLHRNTLSSSIKCTYLQLHASECSESESSTFTRRSWMKHSSVGAGAGAAFASYVAAASPAFADDNVALLTTDDAATMINNASASTSTALCDPSVSTFRNPSNGRVVHILGTAHISSASADVAGQLVRDMRPGAVFVELDAKRVGRAIPKPGSGGGGSENSDDDTQQPTADQIPPISRSPVLASTSTSTSSDAVQEPTSGGFSYTSSQQEDNAPATTPPTPIKKSNPFNLKEKLLNKASQAVGNGIKGMYAKLESEGFNAGEEFVVAVREGLNGGSKIILGDQDVEITLRRLTEALSKTDLKKLLAADSELEESMKQFLPASEGSMSMGAASGGGGGASAEVTGMSKEQLTYFVETVKAKENVRIVMGNLQRIAPELYNALVRERDIYMASGIDRLNQFDTMVAVMGIAHVDGVESTLRERGWEEVKELCSSSSS